MLAKGDKAKVCNVESMLLIMLLYLSLLSLLGLCKSVCCNYKNFEDLKSGILSKTKAEQLEWRRSKVVELRAIGLSYIENYSDKCICLLTSIPMSL
jgi:hypothetical protein